MKILAFAGRALPLAGLLFVGGCATVTRGTTNQIQIESEPTGASVTTSLNHTCTSPCTVTVNRKDEFSVVFRKDGYKEQTIFVKTILATEGMAGFAGNVILGGVIGMGVDAATGSTLKHVPNPVMVTLERDAPPAPATRNRKRTPPKATPAPKPVEPAPES